MKKSRKTVSILLLFSFILLPVSAIVIHVSHGTEISHTWLHLHVLFGIIFMIAGIFHIVYNWKTLKTYLFKRKIKNSAGASLQLVS
jgi:uncharacterized membrane protein